MTKIAFFALFASTIFAVAVINKEFKSSFYSRAFGNPSILYLTPSGQVDVNVGEVVFSQVFLLPENNLVSGVDVVLNYDPEYLEVQSITKSVDFLFGTFISDIDQANGKIRFSALSYSGNEPITPVSGTTAARLADISFLALTSGTTTVSFDYVFDDTNDSNISIIDGNLVVDALVAPVTELVMNIQGSSFPPSPSPSPLPSFPPSPSPSPSPSLCESCWKAVCDGKCNPEKEDSSCPDCQQPSPSPETSSSPSPSPDPCDVCQKGYCDDVCKRVEEGTSCPDCSN